jgi:uncharacterized membrane protein YhaH (DUF805 family)
VPSPLTFSGRATPEEFFGTGLLCQIAGVFFSWIALGYDLVVRDGGVFAFFASLLGPYALAHIPFFAVAIRRGRDAGVWPIFLIVPGLLVAPCALFAIAALAAIIAPNHPWYYWHAIGGLAATSMVSLLLVAVLGDRPSKFDTSMSLLPR